jgi:hypothetical protein
LPGDRENVYYLYRVFKLFSCVQRAGSILFIIITSVNPGDLSEGNHDDGAKKRRKDEELERAWVCSSGCLSKIIELGEIKRRGKSI